MDKNLMEMWGNFFLTAAKGQRQVEEFSKMAKEGFWGFPDMNETLSSFSGMEIFTRASNEYLKLFMKANEELQKSFKDFLALMDLVPRKDYLALQEEYESYKKSVEQKKQGVNRMLDEEMSLQAQGLRSFEELMRNQTKQFQDLMSNFTKLVGQAQTPAAPREGTKEPSARRKPAAGTSETKK